MRDGGVERVPLVEQAHLMAEIASRYGLDGLLAAQQRVHL